MRFFLALWLLEKLYVTRSRRCPIDLASRTALGFNWMLSSAALSCGKLNAVIDRAQLAATLSRTTLSYILKIIWLACSFFLFFFIVNQYKIYNVLHSLCGYDVCPVFFIRLKFLLLAWKLWGENKLFASFLVQKVDKFGVVHVTKKKAKKLWSRFTQNLSCWETEKRLIF